MITLVSSMSDAASRRRPTVHSVLLRAAGAAALAVSSQAAIAQAPAAGEADSASAEAEIIVTASKRSESISNVGSSITALSGDRLSNLGISSFQDFSRLTPGLSFQSVTPGRSQISIRGINVGTTQPSSSVAQYLDETPITAAATAALAGELNPDLDPFDMSRIEVLKGPQGTLYGANALGGVIKYVTNTPEFDRFAAAMSASTGAVHKGGTDYAGKGMVNIPIAEWAALRVVANYRKDAGFIDNVALNDKDVNFAKNRGGRASLELRPVDGLKIRLSAFTQRLNVGGESSVDGLRTTLTPAFGDLTQSRPIPELIRDRFNLYNATISYDFGFATAFSTSSWTDQKYARTSNGPSFAPNTRFSFASDGENKKFVQEVRLQSKDAGGHGLEWQLGFYYTNERYNRTSTDLILDFATGLYSVDFFSGTIAKYEEKAGFANATYYFSPRFDIAAGLRYSENKQDGFGYGNDGNFNGRSGASKDDAITWTVTGRYHPMEDVLLYGNVSRGYRAGGPNFFRVGQVIPTEFEPEELTNYELGLKASTADKRLTFSLAGFYIKWSSIQLPLIVNFQTFRGNNGKAESKGFEASGTYSPIDGLSFSGTLAYTAAKITTDERAGVGAAPGERMAGTPRWSGSLTADYEWALSNSLDGFVGSTFTASSNRPNSYKASVNTPYVLLPGFSTVALRAGVKTDQWSFTLSADNVFDKRGITDDYTFPRFYGETFGGLGTYYDNLGVIRPRTIKATVSLSL
ncbi:TonB-dependent receptor domain-containing protein [Rhizorhabdus histidinilytica]|jgi:outer membrane receptor protein involved in Fe transport|uniref:TonB-dependent receptor domain-containing protein n=1 Tax=Rhizorhabdus histidinilytica TaxID=439228 RepID=UPI001681AB83